MKMYSKQAVTVPFESMSRSQKFVHSYIITGEKGVGKKTAAKYMAMQLLCDNRNACGECRQCKRVLSGQHPDFIAVEKDGRSYSVKRLREKVITDSVIMPNDTDRKVYLMADCDGWSVSSMNALLKITEDPPDHAYFIFTAQSRESFLPTLISRSMVMELHESQREECIEALKEYRDTCETPENFSDERIMKAVDAFGGNIGRCIDYLSGEEKLMTAAETVRGLTQAIAHRDEYRIAVLLSKAASNRDELKNTLEMLSKALRDSAVIRSGGKDITGCAAKGSTEIAGRFSAEEIIRMYDAVCTASKRCSGNCNAASCAASLTGQLV